jgi:hypothetical protein
MIVADFINDSHDNTFFIGVKYFEVDYSVSIDKNIKEGSLLVMRCAMCRLVFKKDELKNSVSHKII